MNSAPPDTLDLLLRHTGGDSTPEMAAELSRRLRDDAAARAELCDLALEALAISEQSAKAVPLGVGGPIAVNVSRSAPWRRWLLPMAAAVALVAGLAALLLPSRSDPEVVRVVSLEGPARWTGAAGRSVEPVEGEGLRGGLIELLAEDAAVTLRFDDGSLITLDGATSATFSDVGQKLVHLRTGSLSASIAKQRAGRPFLLRTPTASIEVLGTRFTVDSAADGTLLNVNEGAVRLTRLADGRVVDVPAEHEVVASAVAEEALIPMRPGAPVHTWRSHLAAGPRGTLGEWLPAGADGPVRLRATPHVVSNGPRAPRTIHRVVFNVTGPPLQLTEGSVIRVRGRVEQPREWVVMLVTRHLRGPYAGNFFHSVRPDAAGAFSLELPLSAFVGARRDPPHEDGAAGLQVKGIHLYSHGRHVGLEIEQVEVVNDSTR